jgi:hypothetical protein
MFRTQDIPYKQRQRLSIHRHLDSPKITWLRKHKSKSFMTNDERVTRPCLLRTAVYRHFSFHRWTETVCVIVQCSQTNATVRHHAMTAVFICKAAHSCHWIHSLKIKKEEMRPWLVCSRTTNLQFLSLPKNQNVIMSEHQRDLQISYRNCDVPK